MSGLNDPIRDYLTKLGEELAGQPRAQRDEALCDAREFLEDELERMADRGERLTPAQAARHFAEVYGTPKQIARAYREQAEVGAAALHGAGGWPANGCRRGRVTTALAILVAAGLSAAAICLAGQSEEPPKLSPFTAVHFDVDRVVVEVREKPYVLRALDGLSVERIERAARDHFGDKWEKRFAEDLVDVLWRMGHHPGATVKLELSELESGAAVTIADAAMTEANRQAVWMARQRPRGAGAPGQARRGGERVRKQENEQDEPPKLSPFTDLRFDGDVAIVRYDGQWYELTALEGIPAGEIVAHAREEFDEKWAKRVAEDLVEVLWGMGRRPGTFVLLELKDRETGKVLKVDRAAMTEANRNDIWRANVQRERVGEAPAPEGSGEAWTAEQVIDEFAAAARWQWSYYPAAAEAIEEGIAVARQRLPRDATPAEIALELQKVIARGIDGHAEVSGWRLEGGCLPMLIEPAGVAASAGEAEGAAGRFVAFAPDRSKLIDEELPYIVAIDGRPLEEWLSAAAALVPKGSAAYVERHALRHLRSIEHWWRELGLMGAETITVTLASRDGERTGEVTLPVAERYPTYGVWPRSESRLLPENVGYLRLPAMDEAAVDEIKRWMPQFATARGLVIDVRDNGGGTRDPLRWINSYLMAEDERPRVINCAKYRRFEGFAEDHLAERFMYRAEAAAWTEPEREAIERFKRSFKPEWAPAEEEFSEWHYMVLDRIEDPAVYHFDKPVAVLMNGKCFSAADVFLSGLKGWPNVTLVGTASSGGSARAMGVPLAGGAISVRLGSMASYMPDGRLFDGNGVTPDVWVAPEPGYFVGQSDETLAAAVKLVAGK